MTATEILSHEHRVIEQVLACLDKIATAGVTRGQCDWTAATQAIEFLRNFADRCHHCKEEDELFPVLEQRGLPVEAGPTAVMRNEHAQGRRLLGQMTRAIESGSKGDPKAAEALAHAATEYIALLRAHIRKEDQCLFPMADRLLSFDDQASLLSRFDATESRPGLAGEHEKYLAIADELASRYCVPRIATATCGGVCGCGHR